MAVLVLCPLFDRHGGAALLIQALGRHRAGDAQVVADDVVVADLRLVAREESGVTHPVRQVLGEPGAPLRAIVVGCGRADVGGQRIFPVDALRDVRDSELVLDSQPGMLPDQLVGELVGPDVQAAPALGERDESGDRHRALAHDRELLADLYVLVEAGLAAADDLVLVQVVYRPQVLVGVVGLAVRLLLGVLRAALPGGVALGTEAPRVAGDKRRAGLLVEQLDVVDLLERPPGEARLVLDEVFQVGGGRDLGVTTDRLVPRKVSTGPHGVHARQAAHVARENAAEGEGEARRRDHGAVARARCVARVTPQGVVVADAVSVVADVVARGLVAPRFDRVGDRDAD